MGQDGGFEPGNKEALASGLHTLTGVGGCGGTGRATEATEALVCVVGGVAAAGAVTVAAF